MRASNTEALRRCLLEGGQTTAASGDPTLTSGDNTVTFPTQRAGDTSGPLLCLVEPAPIQPGGTAVTYKLGATGITIVSNGVAPFIISGLSATSVVVNVSANTTARITFHRVQ